MSFELDINNSPQGPQALTSPSHNSPGLFAVLWQRRVYILMSMAVTIMCALIFITVVPQKYTSTSSIYVEKKSPRIITDEDPLLTQSQNYLYTQATLIGSIPILSSVLEDDNVAQYSTFAGVSNKVSHLKDKLDVSVGKKDSIINISFESPYPEEATNIVRSVVDSYINYNKSRQRDTSSEVLRILQNEQQAREQEVAQKQKMLADFIAVNGNISVDNINNNVAIKRLNTLSDALTKTQLEVFQAKNNYDSFVAMIQNPDQIRQFVELHYNSGFESISTATLIQLNQELNQLQTNLKNLTLENTAQHPSVQNLLMRIAQLKRQIVEENNAVIQAYHNALVQQYVAALQKEETIRQSLNEQQEIANNLNAKISEYTILAGDLERTEKLRDIIDERIKEVNVNEEAGALNIAVLEDAQLNMATVGSEKPRIIGVAVILGFVIGCFVALVVDWYDDRLRNTDEVSSLFGGVSVLGMVPRIADQNSIITRGQSVYLEPVSLTAEAFRSIRTAIYFAVDKKRKNVLLFTASDADEGKSTVLSNTAIIMAQSGQRTLIIDADYRNPTQHKIFRVDSKIGLSDVISGVEPLVQAIRTTSIKNLDVLPCGQIVANPSDLLNSSSFIDILRELKKHYDRIVIDSPPILHFVDARILAAISDCTILVSRADRTTREQASHSYELLSSVDANLLGIIINDVPDRNSGFKMYGASSYYYKTYGDQLLPDLPSQPNYQY